jgi:hypothetical protein
MPKYIYQLYDDFFKEKYITPVRFLCMFCIFDLRIKRQMTILLVYNEKMAILFSLTKPVKCSVQAML